MRATAIYACIAENPGEITFNATDALSYVTDSAEDGWLVATVDRTSDRGLFPVVYTELYPETGDDLVFLRKLQQAGLLSSTLRLEQFITVPTVPVVPAKPASLKLISAKKVPPPVTAPKPKMTPRSSSTSVQYPNMAPALPIKPLAVDRSSPESRHEREREAAQQWEAQHGIKHQAKLPPPSISAKPSRPLGARDALPPTLPARSPSTSSSSTQSLNAHTLHTPSISPATANDAPALPFSIHRQASMLSAAPIIPVEKNIQPSPKVLISQLNRMGFEDNFDPKPFKPQSALLNATLARSIPPSTHEPPSSRPPMPMPLPLSPSPAPSVGSAGIQLTAARHVQGTPRVTRPAPPPPRPPASRKQSVPVSAYAQPPITATQASSINIIPQDARIRYSHLFARLNKEYGQKKFLTTEQVATVVRLCRLPDEQMSRIWVLSDRQLNGQWGPGEFNIIMYLTDCALNHEPIPETLSVELLHSAYN
ncbi:hypothetical protein GGF37_000802 [Kickxella alabastrina]|nr:hypothetical protein GGF37_000802 [Kickxella alabastrina]